MENNEQLAQSQSQKRRTCVELLSESPLLLAIYRLQEAKEALIFHFLFTLCALRFGASVTKITNTTVFVDDEPKWNGANLAAVAFIVLLLFAFGTTGCCEVHFGL